MLHEAFKYYAEKEVEGRESNPVILEMIKEMFPNSKDDSKVAWCSIFMNYVAKRAGYPRSNSGLARSWQKIGEQTDYPAAGDVVVLWRYSPKSWKGHVGIFVRRNKTHVWLLGGNQENAVNIRKYPISRVLSYRKIKKLK